VLACTSWIASTLKLEKVRAAHLRIGRIKPVDGKYRGDAALSVDGELLREMAAPFVSVIVPAASRSSLLKSRAFRGRLDTFPLDRFSPPLA